MAYQRQSIGDVVAAINQLNENVTAGGVTWRNDIGGRRQQQAKKHQAIAANASSAA